MALPVCPSAALPVSAMPPVPLLSVMVAADTELPAPRLIVPPVPDSRLTDPPVDVTAPDIAISGDDSAGGGVLGPAPPVARITSPDAVTTIPGSIVSVPPASIVRFWPGTMVRLILAPTVSVFRACNSTLAVVPLMMLLLIVSGVPVRPSPASTVPPLSKKFPSSVPDLARR